MKNGKSFGGRTKQQEDANKILLYVFEPGFKNKPNRIIDRPESVI
jgi:hypothetical protein